MKVNVNREAFLSVAKRMTGIAPVNSPVAELEHILLEADPAEGKLTVTATSIELTLEMKLPCQVAEGGALTANARLLTDMLERMEGESVALIRQEGKSQMLLAAGKTRFTVPVKERGAFPKPEIPFPEDTVQVSGIPAMAKRTVFAADSGSDTPMLRCVNLRFTRDGLKAAGSDGNCVITAKGDDKSTGDISLLVPAASLDKLASLCTNKDEFRVGVERRFLVFMKENFLFSAILMDGSYIDTDRLINTIRNSFTVLTDAAELRRCLNSVTPVDPDGTVMLSFEESQLTLRCDGTYGSATANTEVIPLTGEPKGEYWYMSHRLEACLRSLTGSVTLGIAQQGMVDLATESAYYIQFPVRPPTKQSEPAKMPPKGKTSKKKTNKEPTKAA